MGLRLFVFGDFCVEMQFAFRYVQSSLLVSSYYTLPSLHVFCPIHICFCTSYIYMVFVHLSFQTTSDVYSVYTLCKLMFRFHLEVSKALLERETFF